MRIRLLLMIALWTPAAFAGDPYRFHLNSDGRRFQLTAARGAQWTSLMHRCGVTTADCQFEFSDRGGSGAGSSDIRLIVVDKDTVLATCLRDRCTIRFAGSEHKVGHDEHLKINIDSDVEVRCE